MIVAGLLGIVAAFGCGVGFVASTVRADRQLRRHDPTLTVSGRDRLLLRWLVASVVLWIGSISLIIAGFLLRWTT